MDTSRRPFIVALYSDAPRAGKSTAARVLEACGISAGLDVELVSFAHPIRRAARPFLPYHWDEAKVREHLSGELKDTPIPELGGKTGRDLLKVIGNTGRRIFGDDLWVNRLLEEITQPCGPRQGERLVIIDDLRFPTEYDKLIKADAIVIRLVTTHPVPLTGLPAEMVDGLLSNHFFHASVPAKGLVTQEMLEKVIADLWRDYIKPELNL